MGRGAEPCLSSPCSHYHLAPTPGTQHSHCQTRWEPKAAGACRETVPSRAHLRPVSHHSAAAAEYRHWGGLQGVRQDGAAERSVQVNHEEISPYHRCGHHSWKNLSGYLCGHQDVQKQARYVHRQQQGLIPWQPPRERQTPNSLRQPPPAPPHTPANNPGVKSGLHFSSEVWPWASNLTSLSFRFLTCERAIIISISEVEMRIEWDHHVRWGWHQGNGPRLRNQSPDQPVSSLHSRFHLIPWVLLPHPGEKAQKLQHPRPAPSFLNPGVFSPVSLTKLPPLPFPLRIKYHARLLLQLLFLCWVSEEGHAHLTLKFNQ